MSRALLVGVTWGFTRIVYYYNTKQVYWHSVEQYPGGASSAKSEQLRHSTTGLVLNTVSRHRNRFGHVTTRFQRAQARKETGERDQSMRGATAVHRFSAHFGYSSVPHVLTHVSRPSGRRRPSVSSER